MESDIEYVVELSLADIRKMLKQVRKSPELKTRMIIKIPKNTKIIAYDKSRGVKGPISSDSEKNPSEK